MEGEFLPLKSDGEGTSYLNSAYEIPELVEVWVLRVCLAFPGNRSGLLSVSHVGVGGSWRLGGLGEEVGEARGDTALGGTGGGLSVVDWPRLPIDSESK